MPSSRSALLNRLARWCQGLVRGRATLAKGAGHRPTGVRPTMEAMEPRILYSADPIGASLGLSDAAEVRVYEDPNASQVQRQEWAFVDARVQGLEAWLKDWLSEGAAAGLSRHVVYLGSQTPGLAQVDLALAGQDGIAAVHLIAHGEAGRVMLGSSALDAPSLQADAARIQSWAPRLTADADILLYACDLAASQEGRGLLERLATLSGADVAASVDTTGHASLGGDWDLEFRTGAIEAAGVLSVQAQASWQGALALSPQGGEVLVNSATASFQGTTEFGGGAVAMDAQGNTIVVWLSEHGDAGEVYYQRYFADGTPNGGNVAAFSVSTGRQYQPAVAMNASGAFVIVATDTARDGNGNAVYARLFDASGVAQGAEFQVNSATVGDQEIAKVAMADDGRFVVTFTNFQSTVADVYAQRYTAAGVADGANFRVNTYTSLMQAYPAIAMAGDGRFVITWESDGQDGSANGIYGQRFHTDFTTSGSEFRLNSTTVGLQESSKIAFAADGSFWVAWESEFGGQVDMVARRFDASGTALTGEIVVNRYTSGTQRWGDLAVAPDGRVIVTWGDLDGHDGSGFGVFARAFDADGNALGDDLRVNETTSSDQADPSIAWRGDTAWVVWRGEGAGDGAGTFVRRLDVAAARTVTVDTTADTLDGNTSSIDALWADRGADGYISLREAITAANNTANVSGVADRIDFNMAQALVNGAHTIAVGSGGLPVITTPMVIDASTEPDFAGSPVVVLDGSLAGSSEGLDLDFGSSGSTIRGLAVVGFGQNGIRVESDNNTVAGNYVGLLTDGSTVQGNAEDGIYVLGSGNVIGGASAADRNVVSGNVNGIRLAGLSATLNEVLGNYVGTDATGLLARGNTDDGIEITDGASDNVIGQDVATGNVVAGNAGDGLLIALGATGNVVRGNLIGLGSDGLTVRSNGDDGVDIYDGALDNMIGGTGADQGNRITGNGGAGVVVNNVGTVSTGNAILGNTISGNTGLGIDLGVNGVTLNDAALDTDTGPNGLQNFPVLSQAYVAGGDISVMGTFTGTANTAYRLEFFRNATGDPTGHGEAQVFLGSASATTDGSGNGSFTASFTTPSPTVGEAISATATVDLGGGSYGNTSEFSANALVAASQAPVIANLAGDGRTYTAGSGAVVVDVGANAVVTDADAVNFDTGRLTVEVIVGVSAEDVIGIRDQGAGAGNITVSGNDVAYGGTTIGSFSGGSNGTPLQVALNAQATPTAVSALLRNITYRNAEVLLATPGTRTLLFVVTDDTGTASAVADAAVTVQALNAAPVIVAPTDVGMVANTSFTFARTLGRELSFSDSDLGGSQAQVTLGVSHGTLSLAQTTGLSFTTGDGASDANLVFSGTSAAIAAALEGLVYTPLASFVGTDTLSFAVSDLGHTGAGGARTDSENVNITIGAHSFLQGQYVEMGVRQTGNIGADTAAPPSFLSPASVYPTGSFGIYADHGRDGWYTGTPPHSGDYVYPSEEWGITVGGTTYRNRAGAAPSIAGSLSATVDTGPTQQVEWTGGTAGVAVSQVISLTESQLHFSMTVTLTNVSGSTLNDVYFYRSLDPNQEYSFSSDYATLNWVDSQGSDPIGTAVIAATGPSYPSLALKISSTGSDARVAQGGSVNINPVDAYLGINAFGGTGSYNAGSPNYMDEAITLVRKVNTLAPGASATFVIQYDMSSNTAPLVDLDADNSTAAGRDAAAIYTAGGPALNVADSDATVISLDSATLPSMTLTLAGALDGAAETLTATTAGTSITANWSGGVLTLSGSDTVAHYQQVLRTVTYDNAAGAPTPGERTVSVVANDGVNLSSAALSRITIPGPLAGPGITVGAVSGNTTEAGGTSTFTVVLDSEPTADVTVPVSVSNAAEGQVSTASLTFTTANWSTPQTVTVTGQDDALDDGDRSYSIVLGAASSADLDYSSLDAADVSLNNTDDDTFSTVTVTTADDTADGDTSSLFALLSDKGADGFISLREAITAANNTANGSGGADRIHFDIAGTGVHTLTPLTALPVISDAVILDATTDDSFAANGNRPAVVLDGDNLASAGLELSNTADGSTIRGFVIRDFAGDGIAINIGSDGHTIAGNYIGSLLTSGLSAGLSERNVNAGIYVEGANNTIGGTTAADRNVIAGNAEGVLINGSSATGNLLIGNDIGTDATGLAALANTFDGVRIYGGATANTVGGSTSGARNVIAGNGQDAVQINGESSDGNTIQGNLIGVAADGITALGNGADGILITSGADNTVIGGVNAGEGNVIGASGEWGIEVWGATSGTLIRGNFVGTDTSGTVDLGNTLDGIAIGNGATNNTVGGTAAGAGNTVAFNRVGVAIWTSGTGNAILGNTIHSNGQIGIDLSATTSPDGTTANDTGDGDTGGNNRQNFPVLTAADRSGGNTIVSGSLNSSANTDYRLEFYSSPAGDASGHGEGAVYLGSAAVTTDVNGHATFNATLTGVTLTAGHAVSATATVDLGGGSYGSTSEFSLNVAASGALPAVRVGASGDQLLARSGEVRANTVTTGSQLTDSVNGRAVASDAAGNSVVVWMSDESGDWDIWAQRYAADGTAQGGAFRVNDTTTGQQRYATVAMDASGRFVVVYADDSSGDNDVRARMFDTSGNALGASLRLNTNTAGTQTSASVAMVDNGGFVAVWNDYGQDGSGSGVYGQRVGAGGLPIGTEFRVNSTTSGSQAFATVSTAASGAFVVTWLDDALDGSGMGVYGQRFLADGSAAGTEFRVNTTTAGDQTGTRVSMDAAGNFVVVWQSAGEDGSGSGVYAQRYAADGSTRGTAFQVNTTTASDQAGPNVVVDATGNFTVVWESDGQDGDGKGIFLRHYNASGAAMTGELAVNTTTALAQGNPAIALGRPGEFILAWAGNGQGDTDGVFLRRFGFATTEAGGTASFSVVLDSAPTADVTVPVSVSNGAEAQVPAALLTFTTANWSTPQTVTVSGQDDALDDGDRSYSIVLGAASSADPDYSGLDAADVRLSNVDNDTFNRIAVTTADDTADGDTSSLSALLADPGADGFISLREAITAANSTANGSGGPDRIHFNISGTGTHTITPLTALPSITQAVVIDASTDDSFAANGNRPAIVLDGNDLAADGLALADGSDGSTIRGFLVRNFGVAGISIWLGADNNTIVGNYLGRLDTSGNAAAAGLGNGLSGLYVGSNNNLIGGTSAADRNVISGNGTDGLTIAGSGNTVIGNYVGVNASATASIGNVNQGVWIGNASSNVIGGTTLAEANVIGGTTNWAGVTVYGATSTGNTIRGNFIGTNASGTLDLGNAGSGIWLADGATGTTVGGTAAGEGNVIAFNEVYGVATDSTAVSVAVLGNAIYSQGGLGIDLADNGVTANDAGDPDVGANGLQNYPVLTGASTNGSTQLRVTGTLNSEANGYYRIEFFANASGDASSHGEGQTYLGYIEVTTDGAGDASFSALLLASVSVGTSISATATKATDNSYTAFTETSEFALNATAVAAAPQDLQLVPGVTDANLLAFYAFSDALSLGRDDAGDDAPITLFGSPAQTTGPSGSGALDLAGGVSGQFGEIVGLSTGGPMTMAGSVRFDSLGSYGWERFVDLGEAQSGGIGAIYIGRFADTNDLTFTIEFTNGTPNYRVNAPNAIVTGSWIHFAATVDAAGQLSLYIDGVLANTAAGVVPTVGIRPNNYIGKSNWLSDDAFDGAIDNLVITNGAMSADQVAALYAQTNALGLDENAADGTVLGTLVGVDPDAAHTLTYSLSDSAGGRFAIDTNTGTLTVANGALLDFESASSHSITAVVTNNEGLSYNETFTITLANVNEAPVASPTGSDLAYAEGSGPAAVDSGLTLSDVDSPNLSGASVQITSNYLSGQDVLAFSNQNGITGSWNAGTGTLTLSGTATLTQYQTALRSVTYSNTSDAPSTATRTVSVTVSDGGLSSATATREITVSAVNDAPIFGTGGDGIVTFNVNGGTDAAQATIVQSDGRILLAGSAIVSGVPSAVLTRLLPNGELDTGFGVAGHAVTSFGSGGDVTFWDVALQSDGKIVATGWTDHSGSYDLVLVRLNADGSADASFGTAGRVLLDLGATDAYGDAVAIQSDGKIVVSGSSGTGVGLDQLLVRFNADGSLDAGFGSGGMVVTPIGTGNDIAYGLAIQADGRIVTGGFALIGSHSDATVARYLPDGSLDGSFGVGGITTVNVAGGDDFGWALRLQADGRIVLAGDTDSGATPGFALRLLSDGSLDPAFGSGGVATLASGSDEFFRDVTLQADGRLLLAGSRFHAATYVVTVIRLLPDGSLDTSYGDTGRAILALGSQQFGNDAALQADGSLIVAGGTGTSQLALRLDTTGASDLTFGVTQGVAGSVAYTEGGPSVVLDADATLFDAELSSANNFSGSTLTLARSGGGNADDALAFAGGNVTVSGADVFVSGVQVGTYLLTAGELVVEFGANATQARVNTLLQSIIYWNWSDAPPASVQIDWTFDDGNTGAQGSGGALQATGSTTVTISGVNDAPVVTSSGSTLAYTENEAATAVDPALTVSDGDSTHLTGATVQITGSYANGQDVLAFTNQLGITGSWSAATGVLTLSGTTTVANYQTALRSITYANTSEAPSTAARTVSFTVTDGSDSSNTATRTISVAAGNDAPVLDLDGPGAVGAVGAEGRVNATTAGSQSVAASSGAVAADASGNHVVVWSGNGVGDTAGVFGQRYDAAGQAVGGEFRINATTSGAQAEATVAMNDSGAFVVVWSGNGPGDPYGIFGQRYDAAGNAVGGEFRISTTNNPFGETIPSVAINDSGAFVVTWQDSFYNSVFAQRFDSAGLAQGAEILVANATGSPFAAGVDIGIDDSGNFVVVWGSFNTPGDDEGIFMRRYDASGNALTAAQQVNQNAPWPQSQPSIAVRDDGSFVIAWASLWQDADGDGVYARRFDTDGTALADEFRVNTLQASDQNEPSVALTPDGGFLVTWSSDASGSVDIQGQRYAADGTALSGEFKVNSATAGAQDGSSVAVGGNGQVIVVWDSSGQDGSGRGVYAQRFSLAETGDRALAFVEGGGAVLLADSTATLTDVDSATIVSLTVTITNRQDGTAEVLNFNTPGTSITGSYDSGTGVLTLSGSDTVNHYQQVLRTVSYNNTSQSPGTTARVITFVANDGTGDSALATATVSVTSLNDVPVITSDGGGATAALNVAENSTAVTTVTRTDGDGGAPVYSIVGGADAARFSIGAATGVLSWVAAPNFEAPSDVGGDNVYDVRVQVSDGMGGTDTQDIAVTVTAVNEFAPLITSNGGGASAALSVVENTAAVTTVTATDADLPNAALQYSIVGGADAGLFTINASSGALQFAAAPDFESPADAGADNLYQVLVQVSDGVGLLDEQLISITVTDGNESPMATITPADYAATEQVSLLLSGSGLSVADPDAGALSIRATLTVSAGQLSALAGSTGVLVTGSETASLILEGTVAELNSLLAGAAGGELRFLSPSDATPATATLTLLVEDLGHTGAGGPLSATDSAVINLAAVNDAPTIGVPPRASLIPGQTLVFDSQLLLGIAVADADLGASPLTLNLSVSHGVLTLASTSGLSFSVGTGTDDTTLTVTGSLADLNAALQGMSYRNNLGFTGDDTLSLQVSDLGGTGSGGVLTGSASVGIYVGSSTFLQGRYLEVGVDQLGNLGSDGPAPAGFHSAGQLLGAEADTGRDGWATYDGDFITPGSPLEEWGLQIGATTYRNNSTMGYADIAGASNATVDNGLNQSVLWTGAAGGLSVEQAFVLNRNDLNLDIFVTLTNTSGAALTDLYYYRHVDPDNNYDQNGLYVTTNNVLRQGNANGVAFVTASQPDGSEMGLLAQGTNARAAWGGFGTVDPASAWSGVAGYNTMGSGTVDQGITVVYRIPVLADGESVMLNLRYVFTSNRAPYLDLDANDSNMAGTGYSTSFTEGDSPVFIVDDDAMITDADTFNLRGLTATITNLRDGAAEVLAVDTSGTAINASYSNGVLTLTGTDTIANYNAVLSSLTYENTSLDPGTVARDIVLRTTDGFVNSNLATVTVAMQAVNDAPEVALPPAQTVGEDSVLVLSAANGQAITLSDVDAGSGPLRLTLTVSSGTLSLGSAAGLSFLAGDGTGDAAVSVEGSLANLNAALDGLQYAPAANASGPASVSVSLNDRGNSGAGGAASITRVLDLLVTPENDEQQLLINAGLTVPENATAVVITPAHLRAVDIDHAAPDLRYTLTSPMAHGSLRLGGALLASGDSFSQADIDAGLVTYSHDGSENSADALNFQVDDGVGAATLASLAITITPVNDQAPVITSLGGADAAAVSIAENTLAVTTVRASDADRPASTLVFSIAGGADAGLFTIDGATGAVHFAAAQDFEAPADADGDGAYELEVRVSDGLQTDTQRLSVTVTPVNDNDPVITSQGGAASAALTVNEGATAVTTVTATDADLPASALVYRLAGGADAALFAIDASTGALRFRVSPDREAPDDADADNVYEVTVQVDDGAGRTGSQSLRVTVQNADEPPAITALGLTVTEGGSVILGAADFVASDPDTPPSQLMWTVSGVSGGQFEATGQPGLAVTAFTQQQLWAGEIRFVHDGSEQVPAFQAVVADRAGTSAPRAGVGRLTLVNDAPVIAGTGFALPTITEDEVDNLGASVAEIWASAGPGAVTDAEGTGGLGLVITGADAGNGRWQFSTDGGVSWSDLGAVDAAQSLHLASIDRIRLVPDARNATAASLTAFAWDGSNGLTSGARAAASPGGGGAYSATSAVIAIRVSAVNDAPVAEGGATRSVAIDENTTGITVVQGYDIDQPSQVLGYSIAGGADAGRFQIDSTTGELSLRAAANFEQPTDADADNRYVVQVRVDDGQGGSQIQTLTVRVNDVNDAPQLLLPDVADVMHRAPNGTLVTQAQALDEDAGQTLSYSLVDDAGGRVRIDMRSGSISVARGDALDFTVQRNWSVVVQVTDAAGAVSQQSFELRVIGLPVDPGSDPVVNIPAANGSAPTPGGTASGSTAAPGAGSGSAASAPAPAPAATAPAAAPAPSPSASSSQGASGGEGAAPEDTQPDSAGQSGAGAASSLGSRVRLSAVDADVGTLPPSTSGGGGRGPEISIDVPGARGERAQSLSFAPVLAGQLPLQGGVVSLELTRALLDVVQDGASESVPGLGALIGKGWSLGTRSAGGDLSRAVEDVFSTSQPQNTPAEQLLIEVTQPDKVVGVSLTAGFVWWLTRGGGLLASMLMGVPAWRHMDLLPVMARADEDEDDDDNDDRLRRDEAEEGEDALEGLFDKGGAQARDLESPPWAPEPLMPEAAERQP